MNMYQIFGNKDCNFFKIYYNSRVEIESAYQGELFAESGFVPDPSNLLDNSSAGMVIELRAM